MSADNWSICPRCKAGWEVERAAVLAALDEQYGKVSREEYKQLEAKAEKFSSTKGYEERFSLREDYEQFLDEDGRFYSDYTAHCTECDFNFKFHHEVDKVEF